MALRLLLPLLLLAAALLVHPARGITSQASDCCLSTSQRNIPLNLVKSYSIQGPESGCLLRAAVFTTKKGKKLCASLASPAAQKLMKKLDRKNTQSAGSRRKGSQKKGQQA